MKPLVKEWGTERTKWDDVKERRALAVVNHLLETDDPEDVDVERYLAAVKAHPQLRRFSREELRRYLATRPPAQPEPPSEPHQVIPECRCSACGHRFNYGLIPEVKMGAAACPGCGKVLDQTGRVFEGDDDIDPRAEVDRLLPTKTYNLAGNSMIHAPGVIRMAQSEWRNGRKKQKAWAMNVLKSWQGLPEEVYLKILNGEVEIETQGDNAVVTLKLY